MALNDNKLTAEQFTQIYNLFENQNWEIEEDNEVSLFQRFCDRTAALKTDEQKELFLSLSKRYLWIPDEEYRSRLINVMHTVVEKNTSITTYYVYTLQAPEDEGKIKSAGRLVYLFNDTKFRYDKILHNYRYEIVSDIGAVADKLNDTSVLLLVDDFVGSGQTAMGAIEALPEEIPRGKIQVLCLVCHEMGKQLLAENGIECFQGVTIQRGITDFYKEEELEEKLKIMAQIEKKMKVSGKFKLGFEKSEALVTMIRTPNNTFPVFWLRTKTSPAPFPR